MAPALLMVCLLARDEVTTLALRALTAAPHPLRLLLGQENVPAELRAALVSSGGARESPLFPRGPASLLKVSLQASRPMRKAMPLQSRLRGLALHDRRGWVRDFCICALLFPLIIIGALRGQVPNG